MIFNQVFTFFFILSTTSLSISHSNGLERRSKHFSPIIRRQGGIGATTVGSNGSTSIPVDSAVIMSSSSTSPTDGGVGASPLGPVSSNSVTNSSSLGSANVVTSPNTGIGAKPLDNPGDETIGSDGKLSGTIPNGTDGGIAAVSSSTTTTTTTTKATKTSTTTESTKATKTDTTAKSTKTTSDRTTTTVKDRKTTTTTSSKATSTSSGNTILSCTVSMSSSTKSKSQKYAHQGYESCADKLKSSGVASGVSSGMALCYRTGYIDSVGKNFGSELTVWSVGKEIPSSILKAISLGLTSVDGQSFVTQSGSLSTPKNNNFHGNWSTIDLSGPAWSTSVDGNLMTLVASYHFSGALPSNFKASSPDALVPTIDMYGLNSTDTVKVLGLLDTTSEKDVTDGPWGMWEKVIGDHGSKRMARMVRRGETGGFVDKALKKGSTAKVDGKTGNSNGNVGGFKDKSLSQSSQSSDKSASASTSSEVGKIGVKSGKSSDYKNGGKDSNRGSNGNTSNNSGSGGLKVGDTVIIGDEVCKVISTDGSTSTTTTTTTTTKTTTTTTSTSTSTTTKDKTTTTTKDRTTTTTTTTTKATTTTTTTTTSATTTAATTTTTTSDSSTTTTTTDSSTSTSGVGANVVGFVSSTSLAATTTTTTAITSASAEGAAVVGFTSMSGSQISSTAPGSTGATAAADTAPSASSTAFQLPGRQLQVLPIGLGVFGGISVIALVIVGVVTYERRKYRRQFRQRKMQEQISSAAGYGSTNRMTEARI